MLKSGKDFKKFLVLAGVIMVLMACGETNTDKNETPLVTSAPRLFSLNDVTLLNGPFKTACELNQETLLKYDVDRLLAPFLKEAGLTPKGSSYSNWNNGTTGGSLDGHVGGHYLSALAMTWSVTQDSRIKQKLDYMIEELRQCQNKNGNGYVGGVLQGMALWERIKNGDLSTLGSYWVPWYNLHKIYAGLRDAWIYAQNDQAKEMFLSLCDWGLTIIEKLTDEKMEEMLNTEFGGMNEVYADAYEITRDIKYLNAAKRFSHKWLLDSMANQIDNLNGSHANTQVPKVVGYSRVALLDKDDQFKKASDYFWDRVVNFRSVAFGGNSRNERFRDSLENYLYLEWVQGPETCNTYNMLKLTENLFMAKPQAKHADYYERALYNHILSTQNPQTGGYVYFTPLRPEHYRVYSTSDLDMWCCVGTGMENHAKYGAFIYANAGNALYVNLFVSSELNWGTKGAIITQTTNFPDEETSSIKVTVDSPTRFAMRIRYPWWVGQGGMQVNIGGKNYAAKAKPDSYIEIDRTWKNGDTVEIIMPMDIYVEHIENVNGVLAIMRGPILLCAETETESGLRIHGDGSRMGQEANGKQISLNNSPVIIGEPEEILEKLKAMQEQNDGTFKVPGLSSDGDVVLKPFFRLHDSRYMMYWMYMTEEEYTILSQGGDPSAELHNRTVDRVMPAEQQSEAEHNLQTSGYASTGMMNGEYYRMTREAAGWFQYRMSTEGRTDLTLLVRYWGNEVGARTFDINIDGTKLVTENTSGKWKKDEFVNVEYAIPANLLTGKTTITVRFVTSGSNYTGGIYGIRLLKPAE